MDKIGGGRKGGVDRSYIIYIISVMMDDDDGSMAYRWKES